MIKLNSLYKHYKKDTEYVSLDDCAIQINGEWEKAIIYEDINFKKYVRTETEFLEKFKKVSHIDKLIRDNYDTIIESDRLEIIDDEKTKFTLYKNKINEELNELKQTNFEDVYEYADVIETIFAMANFKGITVEQIEIARLKKLEEKGGFKKCLVLKE